jgi:outer membrane protein, heavy metal efflux system
MENLAWRGAIKVAAFLPYLLFGPFRATEARADGAKTPPLTLEAALDRFRVYGFDFLIADEAIAGARGDVAAAGAVANPIVSVSRGHTRGYDPGLCEGCANTSYSAAVTDPTAISDMLSGKRRLRVAVARAALDVAKHSRADIERTLEFTVKQQILQAELAKVSATNANESARLAAGTLDLVHARYKAGAVSEADVARADVQKLEADQALDIAEQALATSEANLAYLLGYGTIPPDFDVSDDLAGNVASRELSPADPETLKREALARRPDVARAASEFDRARAALDLARRLAVPDISPSLQYSQEGTGQNALQPPTITLGLSIPLPLFYRYRGERERAEADLRADAVSRRKIESQVAADVETAVAAFDSARTRLSRMEGSLLARAGRARDLVRLQYEKGVASLFEYLDSQRTYLGTQNEYLQSLNDYWTAVFQLEQATGAELHP